MTLKESINNSVSFQMIAKFPRLLVSACCCGQIFACQPAIQQEGLLLDLDAAKGITLDAEKRVVDWKNQAVAAPHLHFTKQDQGRKIAASGCPSLRAQATANQQPSVVFRQQELVCADEDVFDELVTGKGYTWIVVLAVHEQRLGVKDVNSFFGNLRNGAKYEGIWGCLDDDNTVWMGSRNGKSFGRFDQNNPRVSGPILEKKMFHIVSGRMQAGVGEVNLSLHLGSAKAHAEATFPVNAQANPSRMAIGQERDAIEHPGYESFDGEIARFLLWRGALSDAALTKSMSDLAKTYAIKLAE
jgi:hypothetical protein